MLQPNSGDPIRQTSVYPQYHEYPSLWAQGSNPFQYYPSYAGIWEQQGIPQAAGFISQAENPPDQEQLDHHGCLAIDPGQLSRVSSAVTSPAFSQIPSPTEDNCPNQFARVNQGFAARNELSRSRQRGFRDNGHGERRFSDDFGNPLIHNHRPTSLPASSPYMRPSPLQEYPTYPGRSVTDQIGVGWERSGAGGLNNDLSSSLQRSQTCDGLPRTYDADCGQVPTNHDTQCVSKTQTMQSPYIVTSPTDLSPTASSFDETDHDSPARSPAYKRKVLHQQTQGHQGVHRVPHSKKEKRRGKKPKAKRACRYCR